jgi:hypothetical protein
MLDRDPNARVMGQPSDIALVVLEIWTDHKPGPDGTLIAVDKVKFGKKGAENYERIDEIPRLKRQEPEIYEWFEKNIYLGWQKHRWRRGPPSRRARLPPARTWACMWSRTSPRRPAPSSRSWAWAPLS